ncbi:MAG: hypothetical protein QF682_04570 [Candidatus Thermoplasmatota archaeon]|nr:hypothetical protein [Candidatus Thermoplasmatota archaeon]
MEIKEITKDEDPLTISKIRLGELILKKHRLFRKLYTGKIKGHAKMKGELEKSVKELKRERDSRNENVQVIKSSRNQVLEKANKVKKKFFDLMKEQPLPDKERSNLHMYQGQLRNVEWKLETEGIDLETEKRLMKEARLCFQEIEKINDAIKQDESRRQTIAALNKEIAINLKESQEIHEMMIKSVKEADPYHDQWINARRKLREINAEAERSKRWNKGHKESLEYWGKYLKQLSAEEKEAKKSAIVEKKGDKKDKKTGDHGIYKKKKVPEKDRKTPETKKEEESTGTNKDQKARVSKTDKESSGIKKDEKAGETKADKESSKIDKNEKVGEAKADEKSSKIDKDQKARETKADEKSSKIDKEEKAGEAKADEESSKIDKEEKPGEAKADEKSSKIDKDEKAGDAKADEKSFGTDVDEKTEEAKTNKESTTDEKDDKTGDSTAETANPVAGLDETNAIQASPVPAETDKPQPITPDSCDLVELVPIIEKSDDKAPRPEIDSGKDDPEKSKSTDDIVEK